MAIRRGRKRRLKKSAVAPDPSSTPPWSRHSLRFSLSSSQSRNNPRTQNKWSLSRRHVARSRDGLVNMLRMALVGDVARSGHARGECAGHGNVCITRTRDVYRSIGGPQAKQSKVARARDLRVEPVGGTVGLDVAGARDRYIER